MGGSRAFSHTSVVNELSRPVVLIVDDEQPLRTELRTTLEGAGYAVIEAADGAEALGLLALARYRVAVVVSDVLMPGIDGLELVERLARTRPDTPVILASGFHSHEALGASGTHRIAGFLGKPYEHSEVLDVVAAAIARGYDA